VESQTQNHRKWFVAADAPRTEEAIDSLKQIRADEISGRFLLVVIGVVVIDVVVIDVVVIDVVFVQSTLVEAKKSIATPTWVDSTLLRCRAKSTVAMSSCNEQLHATRLDGVEDARFAAFRSG
jgi:hypothetical protein